MDDKTEMISNHRLRSALTIYRLANNWRSAYKQTGQNEVGGAYEQAKETAADNALLEGRYRPTIPSDIHDNSSESLLHGPASSWRGDCAYPDNPTGITFRHCTHDLHWGPQRPPDLLLRFAAAGSECSRQNSDRRLRIAQVRDQPGPEQAQEFNDDK